MKHDLCGLMGTNEARNFFTSNVSHRVESVKKYWFSPSCFNWEVNHERCKYHPVILENKALGICIRYLSAMLEYTDD